MQALDLARIRQRPAHTLPAPDTPPSVAARWFSLKAFACHITVVVLVPAFLTAAWWQLQRAEAGNPLSYLYCVEWPLFAAVAVWAWWQVIHLPPAEEGNPGPAATGWLRWDPADESPALREYNRHLAELNRTGGRPVRELPGSGSGP